MTDTLLGSLARVSWQGAVVIAALWCFCRVFEARRWLSADLRCWLWRGAYVKLLLGLFIAASVALPLLPPPSHPHEIAPVATMLESVRVSEPVFIAHPAFLPIELPIPSEAIRGEKEKEPLFTWQNALAALYLLGVGVCVFRVGQKGLATRRLLQEAHAQNTDADDAEIKDEIARLAPLFGLHNAPRLLRSANVSIPCYAARTVILPADTGYAAQETRLILAHELAHAKRRDLAWEWLGTVAQIVFFFHPLVWLARREERLCREAAADALALRITQARPADYGNVLLRFSLARAHQPLAGVIGIVDRGTLFRRRLLCLGEESLMAGSLTSVRSWKRWAGSAALVFAVSSALFIPWSLQARAQYAPSPQAQNVPASSQLAAEKRKMDRALSNAKQLGLACLMCAADNNDVFKISPATFQKDIGGYLKNNRMDVNAFTSPLDKPGTQSFVFNDALKNMPQRKIINTQKVVMVYEGAWGKPRFRYHGTAIIVFADGHAKFIWPAQAKDLVWSPQAQDAGKSAQETTPRKAAWKQIWMGYEAQKQQDKEASAAIASGDTKIATRLAQQMLKNNTDARDWNYGNVIHQANQILGLAALQEGRVTEAKQFLIASAINPGSPQLDSFGPNMMLAQRLLERGERSVVIQYLDLVERFWAHLTKDELAREKKMKSWEDGNVTRVVKASNQKQLTVWKQQIAEGQTPTLNRSEQLY